MKVTGAGADGLCHPGHGRRHDDELTIDVNVGSWFKDASGAVIDPTKAENQRAIEQAIRASLSAFEDDDHDGDDDHAPEGAGGGGGKKPPPPHKSTTPKELLFFHPST